MSRACVCVTVAGSPAYFRAARLAIASVLGQTSFEVFAGIGQGPAALLPRDARVRAQALEPMTCLEQRAAPFLLKFAAIKACLEATTADLVLVLDVDALIAGPLNDARLEAALGGAGVGMVEQTGIRGSTMNRARFREHYRDHTMTWFAPHDPTPGLADFRYYNGGVVLGRRGDLANLVAWVEARLREPRGLHVVGRHMIADQDYLQFWAHQVCPDRVVELPWYWNHCEHWDEGFPRREALILHFSNFCHGPDLRQRTRMRLAGWRRRWSLA